MPGYINKDAEEAARAVARQIRVRLVARGIMPEGYQDYETKGEFSD